MSGQGELGRWRLVLGTYATDQLGGLAGEAARRDAALDFLYRREYTNRGVRPDLQPGSLEGSAPTLTHWLGEVRELFPRETVEVLEKHALSRYGLTELLTDAKTLERLEPNEELLRTLLTLRGHLKGDVLTVARRIVRQVVEEITKKLADDLRRTLTGRLNRHRHSPLAVAQNFDPRGTLRRNLAHVDPATRRLTTVEQLRFFERNTRRLPWDIILCVDQSGSMGRSVIHAAVMAGILAGLPALRVRIVVFDTNVVDLSEHADDPVEILMSVQLGGGTDIAKAMRYSSQLVENPHRTVIVLVTDFCEGGPPSELVRVVGKLAEARVRLLGLAALEDGVAQPCYDRAMAEQLAERGMEIAALTPRQLAMWLVPVIS